MTLRKLPQAKLLDRPQGYQWDTPTDAFARWAEKPLAAAADEPNTINILDVIGQDPWTGDGFTAKRLSGALRGIGAKPVTVAINSPGGDMFEGVAIYNLLREHPAKVTVDVLGMAASAASVIAMAGDEVRMGPGSFIMVHNAWGLVVGNRHDMADAAKLFEGFDGAMADIYEARTGQPRAEIVKLMDSETFMGPSEAVKLGFADTVEEGRKAFAAAANDTDPQLMARRRLEGILAKAGYPRSQRADMLGPLLSSSTAPRDAGRSATRDAGAIDPALAASLLNTIKGITP